MELSGEIEVVSKEAVVTVCIHFYLIVNFIHVIGPFS